MNANTIENLNDLMCKESDLKIIDRAFDYPVKIQSISLDNLSPISHSDLMSHMAKLSDSLKMNLDIGNGKCNQRTDKTNTYFANNKISSAKVWLVGGFKFRQKNRNIKYEVHVASLVRVSNTPKDKVYVVDLAYSQKPTAIRDYINQTRNGTSRKCIIIDDKNNVELDKRQ